MMKKELKMYRRKNFKKRKIYIIVLIILCFLLVKVFQIYARIEVKDYNSNNVEGERTSLTIEEVKNENITVSEMLENVTAGVVGISKLKNNGNTIFEQKGITEMGMGSGVIVSEKGYILTNEHVSGPKYSNCYITMEDGKNYTADVVWSDSNLDLSIVKINMKCIDVVKLGNSDSIRIGENVYAIGNPIGFEFQKTVTSGIVSALNRTINFVEDNEKIYMSNLIQTDATINPGNSGGPLVNINGEVIGINTVKISSAEGIGFAVPINVVKPIIKKLEENGKFEEASIGIFAYDKDVIPYLNSNINFDTGIYVAQLSLDSPAYRSGLQIGDVITKIDSIMIDNMCDLREYIYTKNIGDVVKLSVMRNNKNMDLEIKLSRK
ncbi:MAG: serine protease [Clostridiales bacterium]|nr:serine protease [Clostridiales bacterium]